MITRKMLVRTMTMIRIVSKYLDYSNAIIFQIFLRAVGRHTKLNVFFVTDNNLEICWRNWQTAIFLRSVWLGCNLKDIVLQRQIDENSLKNVLYEHAEVKFIAFYRLMEIHALQSQYALTLPRTKFWFRLCSYQNGCWSIYWQQSS